MKIKRSKILKKQKLKITKIKQKGGEFCGRYNNLEMYKHTRKGGGNKRCKWRARSQPIQRRVARSLAHESFKRSDSQEET